jgi:tetratricopeptide (TPR) repeat protein
VPKTKSKPKKVRAVKKGKSRADVPVTAATEDTEPPGAAGGPVAAVPDQVTEGAGTAGTVDGGRDTSPGDKESNGPEGPAAPADHQEPLPVASVVGAAAVPDAAPHEGDRAGSGAAPPARKAEPASAPHPPMEHAASPSAQEHGAGQAGQAGRPGRPSDGTSEAPAPPFFGRARELTSLRGDVERAGLNTISGRKAPRARVLLVAGRPGSGRTALAQEIARQLAGRYPDGIVTTRLTEPGGEPVPTERTAREILGRFDIATPPGAGEDELSGMVREALGARRVLLLLDDAVDAEQVDPFVPDNPDCLVVAVAQGPLTGIPDVRPCTLGGMDAKAAIELLTLFAGSVRITVDPQAAESLAEECGGQPAALVLAGGWLAVRPTASVADLVKQLRAVPDDPGSPVGERPVARVFQLVHSTLQPAVARMLRLLSLAPAGLVDAHTASALAGSSVSAARTTLDSLVDLGLLRAAGGRAGQEPAAHDRVTRTQQAGDRAADDQPVGDQYLTPGCLVPLLRALVAENDRPAEVQLARARLLERTVRLLQSCRTATEPDGSPARKKLAALPRALRFPSPVVAAEWLRLRQPALLGSARDAVADGELDTLARRLVAALVRALAAHRGTEAAAPELYGLHRLVLDVAVRRGLHREQAAALLNIGDLDARTGRTQDALTRYRAALDAGRTANDHYATGRAMESLGGAYQDLEDWQRAADWYGRALSQRLSRGERADEARLYGRLGTVHTFAGRYGEALRDWRAALAGHRRLGDLQGQARALSEAGRVQEYAGRPQESLRTCQEAVEWARRAGDMRLEAALELRLADTLDRLGDPTAAGLHRGAADRLLETGEPTYEIRSSSAEG